MHMSIRAKLLTLCVFLVVLGGLILSVPYYVLTTQKTRRQSRERIQIAFDIILNDFTRRTETYITRFQEFLAENYTVLWGVYAYSQEDLADDPEWSMIRFLFENFAEVSAEIETFGRVSLADRVMLYGIDRQLLVSYYRADGREMLGSSLHSADEGPRYVPMDDLLVQSEITFRGNNAALRIKEGDLPVVEPPPGVALRYDGEFPESIAMTPFSTGAQLGFRITAPILRRDETLGVLVGEMLYTQDMVAEYAELSQTEVNFFAGSRLSAGTLTDYRSLPGESTAFPPCVTLPAQSESVNIQPFRLNDHEYYQSGCSIVAQEGTAQGRSIGSVIVNLSQAPEQQELRAFLMTVVVISGIGLAASVLLVSAIVVPRFTAPVAALTTAALNLARDNLDCHIDTSSNDELGTLARSFAHMRDEIRQKQAALTQLNAELEQRVERRTAEVRRQQYILETFMDHIPDAVYFKDRDSRITHSNQAHIKRFSVNTLAELVGKTDFDFFPEEVARPKYEQEQEIIRTGEPVLAVEEPDASGIWSLTSKFPLRDEHDTIIGTFGISRDITELKLAQEALKQANSEISTLNTQLKAENVRMGAELDVSRRIQAMMLPPNHEFDDIADLDIVGFMKPAEEVGGDYYDVLRHNGHLLLGIGDVTGHGLESGVIMLMTQTAIRTLVEHGETDPARMLTTLNRAIYRNVKRMGADKFLTFALLIYRQGQLQIIGQHEEVLVVRKNGHVERIDTVDLGFPVGMEEEIGDWLHSKTITLETGDGIVVYTDGIPEAENLENHQYGVDRLCRVVSRHWGLPAKDVQQAVIQDVLTYIGEQQIYDDLTLVVLKQQE